MNQNVQKKPEPSKTFFVVLGALVITIFFVAGAYVISKNTTTTSVVQTKEQVNADETWKLYQNKEYGFEVSYPNNWFVHPDQGAYPDSSESYPRFVFSETQILKDLQCYATVIVKDSTRFEKNTYSLYEDPTKKQECLDLLNRIFSTFEITQPSGI